MNNANNKNCGSCSKQNCSLKCSQCLVQYYCSSKCQKEHWKLHKSKCIKNLRITTPSTKVKNEVNSKNDDYEDLDAVRLIKKLKQ